MGNKEPITSGFGTSDLFDNQLLKKAQTKITYNSIINKVFAKRRRIGMQINNSGMKLNTFNPPTKFTFRHKESITDLGIDSNQGKVIFYKPLKNNNGQTASKNFFITENEYDYRSRPLKIEPELDNLIKKSKQIPKEEKIKKSKLLKAVRGMTQNKIMLQYNERREHSDREDDYVREYDQSSLGKSNIISSSDY